MRLSQKGIEVINENSKIKKELCYKMDIVHTTLWRWMKENQDNGPMTSIKFIETLSNLTDINQEDLIDRESEKTGSINNQIIS